MGVFHSKQFKTCLYPVKPVYQLVRKHKMVNGVHVSDFVKSVVDTKIPSPSDYKLHDLIEAGVSLNYAPVNLDTIDSEKAISIIENLKD